uniref:Peptidase S9 prolyl oligopeptidase catalytic domain-containing protein n=2 Tax=Arion vulgaris TaxID=1028688 RepID=A0A0B7BG74_9EUPU
MGKAGYGTWKSPISSQITTETGVDLLILGVDGDPNFSDTVYWNEIHFDEKGRYVICSSDKSGNITYWTPPDFNARSTVHEYGGGDFFVYRGVVYFSNFKDQVLYKQTSPTATPEAVTDTSKAFRYTDGRFVPTKSRIYCIREDHEAIKHGASEAVNTVVAINPATKTQSVLVKGADFYSSPSVSSDGRKIAWTQWVHPNMPWDSTEIWAAELSDSGDAIVEGTAHKVVGGKDTTGQDLSVIEPTWTVDNTLLYIGDQTDWWNLYVVTNSGEHVNLHETNAEIGGPQWTFGKTSYVLEPNGGKRIVTSFNKELGVLDVSKKTYTKIDTGFKSHDRFGWTVAGSVYCIAFNETVPPQVIRVDIDTGKVNVIHTSMKNSVDSGYFSIPQKINWPTSHEEICYGLYYPPVNKDYQAVEGELPPLLVRAHGGPTGAFSSALDLRLQYFTSRGFAVLLVDYRGSTGYGKKYRHRLRNQWGILDIDDCCSGVKHLISIGKVDPERVCIDGRSAGWYTTLACLTFTDTFKVGVSHFGVADLQALMEDTHKFESRYLDTLLYPLEQGGKEICKQRSPIHNTHRLNTAIGFFQGDEDKIVPPNQAEMMYNAVKSKGLPTMFVLFQGEQHGFRKAENIQVSLDGEFYFFAKVLGFEPADKGIELPIDNL